MPNEIFERGKARNELVIVLHGLRGSPTKMRGVVNAAAAACPDADILAIGLAFGGFLGALATKPAELVAAKVVKRIDRAIKERDGDPAGDDGYQRFTLVGHSFGGVIARKVAIIANGEHPGGCIGAVADARIPASTRVGFEDRANRAFGRYEPRMVAGILAGLVDSSKVDDRIVARRTAGHPFIWIFSAHELSEFGKVRRSLSKHVCNGWLSREPRLAPTGKRF